VYAGPSITVREETVRRSDGSTATNGVLDTPDNLTLGPPQREPEEQDLLSAWFSRADVERMFSDGTFSDAKSMAAYTLLLLLHGQ
jgi:8-oxo-dGDP phosphatase